MDPPHSQAKAPDGQSNWNWQPCATFPAYLRAMHNSTACGYHPRSKNPKMRESKTEKANQFLLAKRRWQLNLLRLSNKQAAKTANHSVKLPRYLAVPKNASSWQQDPLLIWWDGRLAWDCDFIIFGSLPGTLTHMSGSLHMLDGGTEKNHGIFCGCIQQLPKRWFARKKYGESLEKSEGIATINYTQCIDGTFLWTCGAPYSLLHFSAIFFGLFPPLSFGHCCRTFITL